MTGRYANRHGGRSGGRGRGKGSSTTKKPYTRKTIEDYFFDVGSKNQASDYETTAAFVINHIKKTFDYIDISKALRTLVEPNPDDWEPTLRISESADTTIKEKENEQFMMIYEVEFYEAVRRKRTYENNTIKAYALLWERCTEAMQSKVRSRTDYGTVVYDDPIALLRAIREHSLNYQDTEYEIAIIAGAYRSVFTCKQKEGESLQDYTRRFKTSTEMLEFHVGGPIISSKCAKSMSGLDQTNPSKTELMTEQESLFAVLYLENSDQDKNGSILNNLTLSQLNRRLQ
jgi:hypothetical protein